MNKHLVRFVAAFIIPSFLATPDFAVSLSASPNPSLHIPSKLGQVTSQWSPIKKHAPHVLLVQDLHVNEGVQRNIAAILKQLANRRYLTVFVEGAHGSFDVAPLRNLPTTARREVIQSFLEEARITGAEIAAVESKNPMHLWGIDDKNLYLANLASFSKATRRSPAPHPKHPAWQAYYKLADERNVPMALNLAAHLDLLSRTAASPEYVAVVVGGYHTEGITRVLKNQGIGYEVITPSVLSLGDEHAYAARMQQLAKSARNQTLQVASGFAEKPFIVSVRTEMLSSLKARAISAQSSMNPFSPLWLGGLLVPVMAQFFQNGLGHNSSVGFLSAMVGSLGHPNGDSVPNGQELEKKVKHLGSGLSHIDGRYGLPDPIFQNGVSGDLTQVAFHTLKGHLRGVMTLPPKTRAEVMEKYGRYLHLNGFFKAIPELSNSFYGLEHFENRTSFPSEELVGGRYIQVFEKDRWDAEVTALKAQAVDLLNGTSDDLFTMIDVGVRRLMARMPISKNEQDPVFQHLRTDLYKELLPFQEKRDIGISLGTSRDGHQSNIAAGLNGEDQVMIMAGEVEAGADRAESWGGVIPQGALIRHNPPQDPWYILREKSLVLRANFEKALEPFNEILRPADRERLLNRYQFSVDRQILSDEELSKILDGYPEIHGVPRAAIVRAYQVKQSMLVRGQWLVALSAKPEEVQRLFIQTAYKNGMDIFRVFNAYNDGVDIARVITMARETKALVQPVIHYTTDYPTGIAGYVEQAYALVKASGNRLDALVIKDAGGLLEPQEAYKLVKALRTRFDSENIHIPIQIHTHDTRGNRQLTLMEAIRANGSTDRIVVDLGVGKGQLSSPFGQPDLHDFVRLLEKSPWKESIHIDLAKVEELELKIDKEIMNRPGRKPFVVPAVSSDMRRRAVEIARMPGGMLTNFLVDFNKDFRGYAKSVMDKYGIALLNEEGDYTSDAVALGDALIDLIFLEMREVTKDMGGISLVTPTSQWVGEQARSIIFKKLAAGELIIERKSESESTSFHVEVKPSQSRSYSFGPEIKNYFFVWAQDPELQRLYPNADRRMVLETFSLLNDPSIDLQVIKKALESPEVDRALILQQLAAYEEVRRATGTDQLPPKAVIDFFSIVKLTQAWRIKKAYRSVKRQDLLNLIQSKTVTQINIPLTVAELRAQYAATRTVYSTAKETDEDLLLWVLFPKEDQSLKLFRARQEALAEHISPILPERLTQLIHEMKYMGLSVPLLLVGIAASLLGTTANAQTETAGVTLSWLAGAVPVLGVLLAVGLVALVRPLIRRILKGNSVPARLRMVTSA